ncbi:MAG: DUF4270 domain-containing protein [Bacteroidales bacterium]|jgi:hypothetical protein|nr:DUF4270 domain-containing protein [Bacteroidales bacterium]
MTTCFLNYINRIRSSEHKSKYFIPAIIAGFMFFAGSCEDPPSLSGVELLPDSDFATINGDLLPVKSYTIYRDSIASNQPSVSYLGSIYDPYFGTTTCEFVSQLRLGAVWKEDSFTVDSVKLFLQLLNVSGDTASRHYLRMSEIADVIYTTSKYYSSQAVAHTGYSVPDIELPALRADTVNNLEIDVNTAFGSYLMRDQSMLFHSSDTDDFRTFFRGLHFQLISPGNPIFMALSVASPSTAYHNYFDVYGHNSIGSSVTMSFLLDAVTTNAAFNLYKHDYSTAEAGKKIEHINDISYIDTLSYAQTFNGLRTKLLLTTLDSIKNAPEMKGISVNKARLKLPVFYDNDLYRRSTLPATLYLQYPTTTGRKYYVPETGTYFYGGYADTTATLQVDDVYNLNIASFIQSYLDDTADTILPELELFILPAAGHSVILKANNSFKPINFELIYTKF